MMFLLFPIIFLVYTGIWKWEKETGRKMYISYVVNWKRYKEEEKKRQRDIDISKN